MGSWDLHNIGIQNVRTILLVELILLKLTIPGIHFSQFDLQVFKAIFAKVLCTVELQWLEHLWDHEN